MGLACGSARREEKEDRRNEWGWFSQMRATLKRCGVWRNHEKEESLKGRAAEKDQTARETSGSCFRRLKMFMRTRSVLGECMKSRR